MEAMILAAGAGTRLSPLTDQTPKALIPVAGRPLLSHVMDRLLAAGVTRIIVNVCHHGETIEAFIRNNTPPGVEIALSPEPDGPYDTGGGLLAAAALFRRDGPFLLHNVDVLSEIPLGKLLATHNAARSRAGGRLVASLAVQHREGNRKLLFDGNGLLGWENRGPDGTVSDSRQVREPVGPVTHWSFTGMHVLEPAVFELADRTGTFSIITWYLALAEGGYRIQPVDVSGYGWIDVGTHERMVEAERTAGRKSGWVQRPADG
jgi:MurNAc alpha-1-phosphate uridylyltransferase